MHSIDSETRQPAPESNRCSAEARHTSGASQSLHNSKHMARQSLKCRKRMVQFNTVENQGASNKHSIDSETLQPAPESNRCSAEARPKPGAKLCGDSTRADRNTQPPCPSRPSATGSGAGSHTPTPSAQRAGMADWPTGGAGSNTPYPSAQRAGKAEWPSGGAGSHTPIPSAQRAGMADWPSGGAAVTRQVHRHIVLDWQTGPQAEPPLCLQPHLRAIAAAQRLKTRQVQSRKGTAQRADRPRKGDTAQQR